MLWPAAAKYGNIACNDWRYNCQEPTLEDLINNFSIAQISIYMNHKFAVRKELIVDFQASNLDCSWFNTCDVSKLSSVDSPFSICVASSAASYKSGSVFYRKTVVLAISDLVWYQEMMTVFFSERLLFYLCTFVCRLCEHTREKFLNKPVLWNHTL